MKCKCRFCGYEWNSRVEKPLVCSKCKRYEWNVSLKETVKTCNKVLNEINNGLMGDIK